MPTLFDFTNITATQNMSRKLSIALDQMDGKSLFPLIMGRDDEREMEAERREKERPFAAMQFQRVNQGGGVVNAMVG